MAAALLQEKQRCAASCQGSQANAMIRLLETIEDLDDTQNVYSNFDMDEAPVAS